MKRAFAFAVAAVFLAALMPVGAFAREKDGEPIVIDTIEIMGFVAPEWLANPSYAVYTPEGARYYIDWSTWYYYKSGEAGRMYESDRFDDPEMFYYQEFEIWAEEGCTFADDVTVLINGGSSLVDSSQWSFGNPYYLVWTVDFTVEPPAGTMGDADGDGQVLVTDALLVLRCALGLMELSPQAQTLADADGSGDVGVNDALLILRLAMGLIESF